MNTDNSSRLFQYIGLAFALAGIGLLIACWFEYRSTSRFLEGAARTTGTITGNYRSRNSDGEVSYYPLVTFTTAHGKQVEFRSHTGGRSGVYPIGAEVAVLYMPTNPQAAEINSWLAQWFGTTIFGVLGVGFSGMGLVAALVFSDLPVLRRSRTSDNMKLPADSQKRGRARSRA